ncbi:MAG: methyltransferase domain-containing protein [Geobacteraceae bacterium]|nr:methyltransferase domain-containing protein [Geobacteraceae bacterium]
MFNLSKIKNLSIDGLYSKLIGVNSKRYWNYRFNRNWEIKNGRLQTAYFAMGFALLNIKFEVKTILDYGCGCGDSIPVLRMRFPKAQIYFYDYSNIAMEKANSYYEGIATPFDINSNFTYDLVYCSNVIEHISDPISFSNKLISLSNKYVVIQAPYSEKHGDGSSITYEHKIGEHVNTIDESLIESLKDRMDWDIMYSDIPYAWPKGKQIFFIGKTLTTDSNRD